MSERTKTQEGVAAMARRRGELVRTDTDETAGTELLPMVPESGSDSGGLEILQRGEIIRGPGGVPAERPEDVLADPPDARDISAELAAPPRRKLPWLTLVLSACIVAAGAFAGGALVEKNQLQSKPGGGQGNVFAGGGRGGGGAGTGAGAGTAGAGTAGAAAGVTSGTVKLVDGSTIYVTDATGNIVKVTTGGSTKVSETKAGKISDFKVGQSVTVRGSQQSNGDISATTVIQGSAPTGGFGGFGGGGRAATAGGQTGG